MLERTRLSSQIDTLANFIRREVPGEPSQSEGAVDCAMRIIRTQQATIADLQGQVEAWHKRVQEADEAYYAVGELNDALQQRVAQLEGELKRYAGCGHDHSTAWWQLRCEDMENDKVILQRHLRESAEQLGKLQADHARVLGLLNGILKRNQGGFEKDDSDIRLAVNILKEAASLPVQPAQGGAK